MGNLYPPLPPICEHPVLRPQLLLQCHGHSENVCKKDSHHAAVGLGPEYRIKLQAEAEAWRCGQLAGDPKGDRATRARPTYPTSSPAFYPPDCRNLSPRFHMHSQKSSKLIGWHHLENVQHQKWPIKQKHLLCSVHFRVVFTVRPDIVSFASGLIPCHLKFPLRNVKEKLL